MLRFATRTVENIDSIRLMAPLATKHIIIEIDAAWNRKIDKMLAGRFEVNWPVDDQSWNHGSPNNQSTQISGNVLDMGAEVEKLFF